MADRVTDKKIPITTIAFRFPLVLTIMARQSQIKKIDQIYGVQKEKKIIRSKLTKYLKERTFKDLLQVKSEVEALMKHRELRVDWRKWRDSFLNQTGLTLHDELPRYYEKVLDEVINNPKVIEKILGMRDNNVKK